MKYEKLVRDKIPQIIKEKGGEAKTHIAETSEYEEKLKNKLREEVEEFLKDDNHEEMVDILEVLRAMANLKNIDWSQIEDMRKKKEEERGAFNQRIILDES